jgi:predicted transcriptional regulator
MTQVKMNRQRTFTFRINDEEHRLLILLASRLQRSKSDTLRFLVRQAVSMLLPEVEAQEYKQSPNSEKAIEFSSSHQ